MVSECVAIAGWAGEHGKRLRLNRWVSRVKKDCAGGWVSLGKAHVIVEGLVLAGRAGEKHARGGRVNKIEDIHRESARA